MKMELRISVAVCALAVLSTLVGCSQPAPPSPTPDPNAPKAVRSTDPSVMNNPNIPPDIKRQIGGSGGAPKK